MKTNYENKICPCCKEPIVRYPALSRVDNKTEICSKCGILEALETFYMNEKQKTQK